MTGKSAGTGTYSFHERHSGRTSVMTAHMPDDRNDVRITFRQEGETQTPVIKLGMVEAEMLWACLNSMAKDLKWEDYK